MLLLILTLIPTIHSYCPNMELLNCDICEGDVCTYCVPGYSADKNKDSPTYGTCLPCVPANCRICPNDANICEDCHTGTYLEKDKNSPQYGKCVACKPGCSHCASRDECERCKHGYGLNKNNECEKCQVENCEKCGGDYKFCEECISWTNLSALNGKCVDCAVDHCIKCSPGFAKQCVQCEDGYYVDGGDCVNCGEQCTKCNNGTICLRCDKGFYPADDGKCHKCIEHCEQCNEKECLKCENGYYYSEKDGFICVFTGIMNCEIFEYPKEEGVYECFDCYNGYGLSEDQKTCFKCNDPNCIMCDQGPEFCDFCNNMTFWKNGKCFEECGIENCEVCNPYNHDQCMYCKYHYGLDDNYKCEPCKLDNCYDCDIDSDLCLECMPGYRVVGEFQGCEKCHDPNCVDCAIDADYCDYCKDGFHLKDGRCTKCQPGNCHDCADNAAVCFACSQGFGFDLVKGSKTFGQCVACQKNCLSCNFSPSFCDDCITGFDSIAGNCLNVDEQVELFIRRREAALRKKNKKLSGGAIAGIVIAVILAVVAIAAVLIIFVFKKKIVIDRNSSTFISLVDAY